MARRKNSPSVGMPSDQDEFEWSMQRAVEKATLMHPQTQALKKQIEKDMRAAAKSTTKKKATPSRRRSA